MNLKQMCVYDEDIQKKKISNIHQAFVILQMKCDTDIFVQIYDNLNIH